MKSIKQPQQVQIGNRTKQVSAPRYEGTGDGGMSPVKNRSWRLEL